MIARFQVPFAALRLLVWAVFVAVLVLAALRNERATENEARRLLDRYGDLLEIHLWNYDAASARALLQVIAEAGTFSRLEVRHVSGGIFVDHPGTQNGGAFYVRTLPLTRTLQHKGEPIGELRADWHNRELGHYLALAGLLTLVVGAGAVTIRLVAQSGELMERLRSEAALRHAKAEAERANRLKTEFLANMSHEIRTPLNIILGSIELLEEKIDPDGGGPHAKRFADLRAAGQRLRDTIHKIVDISRLRLAEFPLHAETIQLEMLVEETCRTMGVLAERKGLRFDVSVPSDGPVIVRFDLYALRQALFNLIDNAIKYTPQGSVTVTLRTQGGSAVFRVADTGIGIGEEFAGTMFDPFTQEESGPDRRFEGTGLGLALTHAFLSAGGATIEVDSKKGIGTTFTVRIPLHAGEAAPRATPTPVVSAPVADAVTAVPRTIVVVEDDDATQDFMRAALHEWGTVEVAGNAAELDQLLQRVRPNLILMDVGLRGSADGLAITRRLKGAAAFRDIPIVALTGYAMEEDRERAMDAGCDAFLTKPCPLAELRSTVADLLTRT